MNPRFSSVVKLFQSGVNAVLPNHLIKESVSFKNNILTLKSFNNQISNIDLSQFENIFIIGVGKASAFMAEEIEIILNNKITEGIVVTKYGFGRKLDKINLFEAGHPVPDNNSVKVADKIVELCSKARKNDLIINLLSGGASALIEYPENGISLEEIIEVTKEMLASGASIDELNIIRKHISKIKGGGLLKFISPSKVVSLIISDVIRDRVETIGSGITHLEDKSYSRCWNIIEKYNFQNTFPTNVLLQIKKGLEREQNSKLLERKSSPSNITNILIGSNLAALNSIMKKAIEFGYETKIVNAQLSGEARIVGEQIAESAIAFKKNRKDKSKKYCFLYGGETTVKIGGNGKGGRNQELVLAAAIKLSGREGITILSAGTDGNDGPTNAAGAYCDGETAKRANNLNMNLIEYIERNDSYNFFKRINNLVITGPTGTNVMDIQIVLIN